MVEVRSKSLGAQMRAAHKQSLISTEKRDASLHVASTWGMT